MKWCLLLFAAIWLSILLFPMAVSADTGPKPSLVVQAENMPGTECYLDLLVDYPARDVHINIDTAKYNPKLVGSLKEYNRDGWRPAMVLGTMPPLFGDIRCTITNGKCKQRFSYMGVPDHFKIIVVSADGKTVVSNTIKRKAYNSKVFFDYRTARAHEQSSIVAYIRQFLFTCTATLLIEGLIFLLFRFNLKQNLKPFLAINVLTQLLLTVIIFSSMRANGTLYATMFYIPFEIVILISETILFTLYLRQHGNLRRALFALTANISSFFAGILVMLTSYNL